jgi:hypothetical protein
MKDTKHVPVLTDQVQAFINQHLFEPMDQFMTMLEAKFAAYEVKMVEYNPSSHLIFSIDNTTFTLSWSSLANSENIAE